MSEERYVGGYIKPEAEVFDWGNIGDRIILISATVIAFCNLIFVCCMFF